MDIVLQSYNPDCPVHKSLIPREGRHTHSLNTHTHTLTPLKTVWVNFLLTVATHPRATTTLNTRGTCVSYTPSISGADNWVTNSLYIYIYSHVTVTWLMYDITWSTHPAWSWNILSETQYSFRFKTGAERGRNFETFLQAVPSPCSSLVVRQLT